jgi:hypothetical protein
MRPAISLLSSVLVSSTLALFVAACHGPTPEPTKPDGSASTLSAAGSPIVDAAGLVPPPLPPPSDAGRADLRQFCTDVYSADDERMAKKCTAADFRVSQGMARLATNYCADDLNSAVLHARASFDADAAKHCVEMLRAAPMDRKSEADTLFGHYPCDVVLQGSQPEGKPCRFSVECKEGLACEGYAIGVDGVCKKPPKVGEACIIQRFGNIYPVPAIDPHHPACAAGAWCDTSSAAKCQPRVAAGKACATSAACVSGLSCVQGKCGTPGAIGAACTTSDDCAYGTWCDHASGSVCAAKRDAGAPCTVVEACKGRCDMKKAVDAGGVLTGNCMDVCSSG